MFPFCDDQTKKSEEGFHPHLPKIYEKKVTLGNFDTKIIDAKKTEFQAKWTPKEFTVTEVNIIKRDGKDTPFYVACTVSLKQ